MGLPVEIIGSQPAASVQFLSRALMMNRYRFWLHCALPWVGFHSMPS